MKVYPTSVRLPQDIKTWLDAKCTKESRSMTWMINSILRKWMEWNNKGYKDRGADDGG